MTTTMLPAPEQEPAASWPCCPRCGAIEPEPPKPGQPARCSCCNWRGNCPDLRSQDDPAPRWITLRWLRGVHPTPEALERVIDDETALPWEIETLVWLSEQAGDSAGNELAEMAEIAWGVEIQRLDTPNDYHALRHVAEIVADEAVARMGDQDGRDEIRRRIDGLLHQMQTAGWQASEAARVAHDELMKRIELDASEAALRRAS